MLNVVERLPVNKLESVGLLSFTIVRSSTSVDPIGVYSCQISLFKPTYNIIFDFTNQRNLIIAKKMRTVVSLKFMPPDNGWIIVRIKLSNTKKDDHLWCNVAWRLNLKTRSLCYDYDHYVRSKTQTHTCFVRSLHV